MKRAKFIKKVHEQDPFEFKLALKAKTERQLGLKDYVTDISQDELSDQEILAYYHDLWHIEQAFRMSKSDLQTRPVLQRTEDAIRSHVMT